jgi:hypothetical protein
MFSKIKNEQGSDLDASLDLEVFGARLGAYEDYESFVQARAKIFDVYNYNFNKDQASGYARQFLSSEGATAYTGCMRSNAKRTAGVHVWIENATERDALIAVTWTPPLGSQLSGTAGGQVVGSSTPFSVIAKSWPPGNEQQYLFDRSLDRDFRLVINMNGTTDDVLVPNPPKLERCGPVQEGVERRILKSREISVSPDDGLYSDEDCIVAEQGWTFSPGSGEWMPLRDVIVRKGTTGGFDSMVSKGATEHGFRASANDKEYCGYLNVTVNSKPNTQTWKLSGSFIAEVTRPVMRRVCKVVR